ncbi:hypothetical protein [Nitrosomonas sp. JL21]|uniref:hypothetical protein n=1 Tax=Nitrosomonas sp. JL21 TaxID=153949 RepID=UPI001F03382F|nr:hypothetical protein [Nitrosomonas sp. JL21]
MGAIFFYIFVYFVGYYGSNILNMLTVRPLVNNRYMAALMPVYGIAAMHAYMIVTRPLPAGADITVEYALLVFVTLPVVVVTLGATYFMWNNKPKQDEQVEHSPARPDHFPTEALNRETPLSGTHAQPGSSESANASTTPAADTAEKSGDTKPH